MMSRVADDVVGLRLANAHLLATVAETRAALLAAHLRLVRLQAALERLREHAEQYEVLVLEPAPDCCRAVSQDAAQALGEM